jgi:hypothetical protein
MLRSLMALTLLAAPLAAAPAQAPATQSSEAPAPGEWALGRTPEGCMVYAASSNGTVISVWGFAGQDKLAFLIQNKGWEQLQEGRKYALKVAFDRAGDYPVEAVARTDIDEDGPGYFFTVTPGAGSSEGGKFMTAFAAASGMRISLGGRSVDTLPLSDSRGAISALARCMGEMWSAGGQGGDEQERPASPTTTV